MDFDLPFGERRDLVSRLDPEPDPLADVEYSGDLEVDAARELVALESAFRERRKREDARFRDVTDSEYWFAVCFRTRADKEKFLAAVGGLRGDKYLSGYELARRLGIEV